MTRDAAVVISTGSDLFIRYRVSLFFEDESLCCHVEFTPFSLLSRSLFVCERLFLRGGSRLKYSTGEASLGILIRLTASRPADVKRMGFWREQMAPFRHSSTAVRFFPVIPRARGPRRAQPLPRPFRFVPSYGSCACSIHNWCSLELRLAEEGAAKRNAN